MCDTCLTRPIHPRLDHLTHINMSGTNDYITFFMSVLLTSVISGLVGPELVTENTDIESQ